MALRFTFCLLALFPIGGFGQDDQAEDARSLMDKLRSSKPEERHAAAQKLKALGRAAVPALEAAGRDSDSNLAEQARYLLRVVPLREKLSPELFELMPELEERLARGGTEAWTAALMETLKPGKNGNQLCQELKKKDLEALAEPAVSGEKDPYLRQVAIQLVADLELRGVLPAVAGLLRDPDPVLRAAGAKVIGQLRAHEFTPPIAALLKDADAKVRSQALGALKALEGKTAVREIAALLSDVQAEVRGQALWVLGELGAKEAAPAVAALLRDDDPDLRAGAAMTLGNFGYKEAIPRLSGLLHDPGAPVRRSALWALAVLGANEAVPEITKLLEDPDARVRARAAECLTKLNAKELRPRIVALLEDPDDEVRFRAAWSLGELGAGDDLLRLRKLLSPDAVSQHLVAAAGAAAALGQIGDSEAIPDLLGITRLARERNPQMVTLHWLALHALGTLGGKSQAPEIRRFLRDPEAFIRSTATQALGRLGCPEDAEEFAKLLRDPNDSVRLWSGLGLARLGRSEGLTVILGTAPKTPTAPLLWLNRLRCPEAWKRLEEARLEEALEGTQEELLAKLARKAGLSLELETPLHKHLYRSVVRIPGGGSLAQALDRAQSWQHFEYLTDSAPSRVRYELLLEPDRLRVVSRRAAIEVWKIWEASVREKK